MKHKTIARELIDGLNSLDPCKQAKIACHFFFLHFPISAWRKLLKLIAYLSWLSGAKCNERDNEQFPKFQSEDGMYANV